MNRFARLLLCALLGLHDWDVDYPEIGRRCARCGLGGPAPEVDEAKPGPRP